MEKKSIAAGEGYIQNLEMILIVSVRGKCPVHSSTDVLSVEICAQRRSEESRWLNFEIIADCPFRLYLSASKWGTYKLIRQTQTLRCRAQSTPKAK